MTKKTNVTLYSFTVLIILAVVVFIAVGFYGFTVLSDAFKTKIVGIDANGKTKVITVDSKDPKVVADKFSENFPIPTDTPVPTRSAFSTDDSSTKFRSYVNSFSVDFNGEPTQNQVASPGSNALRTDYSLSYMGDDYAIIALTYPTLPTKDITKESLDSILNNVLTTQNLTVAEPTTFDPYFGNGTLHFLMYNSTRGEYIKGMLVTRTRDNEFFVYIVSVVSFDKEPKGAANFLNSFELTD